MPPPSSPTAGTAEVCGCGVRCRRDPTRPADPDRGSAANAESVPPAFARHHNSPLRVGACCLPVDLKNAPRQTISLPRPRRGSGRPSRPGSTDSARIASIRRHPAIARPEGGAADPWSAGDPPTVELRSDRG